MKALLLFIFLVPSILLAQTLSHEKSFKTYDEALKSEEKIVFKMVSYKLRFIKNSFEGVVKKISVQADKVPSGLKNIVLTFKVEDMDTDIKSRNEKMWNECLDYKNHPEISVKIDSLNIGDNDIEGTINILGKDKKIPIRINLVLEEGKYISKGESQTSLSALEVPNPGIAVASVADEIKIEFQITR